MLAGSSLFAMLAACASEFSESSLVRHSLRCLAAPPRFPPPRPAPVPSPAPLPSLTPRSALNPPTPRPAITRAPLSRNRQISEDVRTFLTAQYGQNGGKGDPYLLEALGALMGGGHPDAFQPILDMLTEVIKGTERPGRGWPIGESAAAGATPTTQETADPAPLDLPTVLANRRAAYVVLDRVSASFKVTPTPDLIARHPRPSFSKRLT